MITIKTPRLRLAFALLETQTDEITVRVTGDGWTIRAVSPDHVSMISAELPVNAFDSFENTGDFAVTLKNINKALSKAGDVCNLDIRDGRFVIVTDNMTYKFPQNNVSDKEQKIPNIEYDAGATLPVGEIARISSAVFGSVDAYAISVKDNVMTIEAADSSDNGVKLDIPADKCLSINGEARSTFAIECLDRFLKVLPKDAIVDVSLGTNVPVTVYVQDDYMRIRYLLAPRIEQD